MIGFIYEKITADLVKSSFGAVLAITHLKWVQKRMGKEEMARVGILNS